MTSRVIGLRDKLVLARLRISSWNGKVASDKAARDAEEAIDSKLGTVELKISQVAKEYTRPIEKECRALYRWWTDSASLPWGDGGWRVMPVAAFSSAVDRVAQTDTLIKQYAAASFGDPDAYEKLKEDSRDRLQDLFSEATFPSAYQLMRKYGVSLSKGVMADPKGIRLAGMSGKKLATFRSDIEDQYRFSLDCALLSLAMRMTRIVRGYQEKINVANQTDTASRFGKIFRSIHEQCEDLYRLNLTASAEISEAIASIAKLTEWDLDAMNSGSGNARSTAAAYAADLSESLQRVLVVDGNLVTGKRME